MNWTRLCLLAFTASLLLTTACTGGGGGGPTPAAPAISSFVANPASITAGASTQLTGVFTNGTGVITPGNLPEASGQAVTVTPNVPTTYILTVTGSTGTSVQQTISVAVVPAGAMWASPNSVLASGVQQITPGTTFTNGPVVGEPVPATSAASPSGTLQVRNGFTPPSPK